MASLRNRVKEVPAEPARRREWAREQWRQMAGQMAIQRVHLESDLKNAPFDLAKERVRLKAKGLYELWRWGLLMLGKGSSLLSEPGPDAFRSAGMNVSAMLYEFMQDSHVMREGLRRLQRAYQYAAGQ
jgi:hypothetical protein